MADNDLWIAACALRHSIPLVSNNDRHFTGVPGLVLISEAQAIREIPSQTAKGEGTATSAAPPYSGSEGEKDPTR